MNEELEQEIQRLLLEAGRKDLTADELKRVTAKVEAMRTNGR